MTSKTLRYWIEAMRLRTLPVSVAGVITAIAASIWLGHFRCIPALLCMTFAVLAQIASNFANEYYDYRDGLDRPGREGPRRGVTEGDITPKAMKRATFATLGLACAAGLGLVAYGGWWLIIVGIVIALGALAYSAGPFPLSRNGLGEVAVMFFFGIIPVNFTYYVQAGDWSIWVALASLSIGLMGANVLIVNNYRDRDADKAVGKRTLAVIFGRAAMSTMYLTNGFVAALVMAVDWWQLGWLTLLCPLVYLALHTIVWWRITVSRGAALNPMLGMTAMLMLAYSLMYLVCCLIAA